MILLTLALSQDSSIGSGPERLSSTALIASKRTCCRMAAGIPSVTRLIATCKSSGQSRSNASRPAPNVNGAGGEPSSCSAQSCRRRSPVSSSRIRPSSNDHAVNLLGALRGDQPVLDVPQHQHGVALPGWAEAATAGRLDVDDSAGRNLEHIYLPYRPRVLTRGLKESPPVVARLAGFPSPGLKMKPLQPPGRHHPAGHKKPKRIVQAAPPRMRPAPPESGLSPYCSTRTGISDSNTSVGMFR